MEDKIDTVTDLIIGKIEKLEERIAEANSVHKANCVALWAIVGCAIVGMGLIALRHGG
jgi:hypothetical protein